MNIAIRYYTKTGNTKKLADAIAEAVGVPAESVDVPLEEPIDVLFLGSSVYAAGVDGKVKDFIASLDVEMVEKVVNFSTAALLPSTFSQVTKLLSRRGIPIDEREFHCRGKFKFMHSGHPDQEDLRKVQTFATGILNQL
jgi:flavodoxin